MFNQIICALCKKAHVYRGVETVFDIYVPRDSSVCFHSTFAPLSTFLLPLISHSSSPFLFHFSLPLFFHLSSALLLLLAFATSHLLACSRTSKHHDTGSRGTKA